MVVVNVADHDDEDDDGDDDDGRGGSGSGDEDDEADDIDDSFDQQDLRLFVFDRTPPGEGHSSCRLRTQRATVHQAPCLVVAIPGPRTVCTIDVLPDGTLNKELEPRARFARA